MDETEFLEESTSVHISNILDLIIHIDVMQKEIQEKQEKYLSNNEALIYEYLRNNDLISGSTIYKTLKYLRKITAGLKHIENLTNLLNESEPSFESAQEAFYEYLKTSKKFITIYIDNIDDFGFDFSVRNRSFFNALLSTTMRINSDCMRRKIPFRVTLMVPSELYDTAVLWNRDKIKTRRIFLNWDTEEKIRNLVCKRIAIELNIKKSKPRYEGDIYSISKDQTWDRIFPEKIQNNVNKRENTLRFILRHSLYTPRTVLDICSAIINAKQDEYGFFKRRYERNGLS